MKIKKRGLVLKLKYNRHPDYPMLGMLAAMLLIYLSPFTGSLTSYAAFVICLCRIARYDAKVFATDYCLLVPLVQIFCTAGGMSLFVYLCLLAAVWYFVRSGIRTNGSYILLIVLMNYLILRMQTNFSEFLLCFGQICVLCIVLPEQDQNSACRAIKLFCVGLVISSLYGLVFRNTWQLRSILGSEDEAIWGTGIKRFAGLYRDPNYYMTLLIVGLSMVAKLKNFNQIGTVPFLFLGAVMVLLGILTYSKTFFFVFILFGVIYIIWRFRDRKYFMGILLIIGVVAAAEILFRLDIDMLGVLMDRIRNANSLSELTTGRTEVYTLYLSKITHSVPKFLFGVGLSAEALYKDPHNLYLELMYYLGLTGLVLMLTFFGSMVRVMQRKAENIASQSVIAKYVPLFLMAVLYLSLHGMTQMMFYGGLFISLLSILIAKKPTVDVMQS